ncbi:MAG: 1-acyl-sn-glycerol-3-phosphate acyltransferase [Phycisphaerales bacterium]|nr:1-acyl-sn-glycerol-3-phosphate acyltransferase [Phycisphaerales bacterium]
MPTPPPNNNVPAMRYRPRGGFVYRTMWLVTYAILTAIYGLRALHRDRLPMHGPCLILANHQSFLDPVMIGLSIRQRAMCFLARVGLMSGGGLWSKYLLALNCIAIDTSRGDTKAMKACLSLLDQGAAVLVFPEGSRSHHGQVEPFKAGAGVLVKRAKCPVIPVAVEGAYDAYPRRHRFPRLLGCRVVVVIGEPIDPDELLKDGIRPAMADLANRIDALRLEGRRWLRHSTAGNFPVDTTADAPSTPSP